MPARIRSATFRVLRILAIVYVAIVAIMMLAENSLVYHPLPFPEGNWHPTGLPFEDVSFIASDGVKLNGWWLPHDKARAYVLFAHGNAGNVTSRVDLASVLRDRMDCAIFMFDYRGFGKSEGAPSESGILDDARSARRWLAEHEHIPENKLVLMGESLGGGVAVDLAAKDGARGLVLMNTFSSLPDVGAAEYPWLPVQLLMRNRLNSAAKIGDYHGPLLQIHGDADMLVPYWSAQKLFDAANTPKKLITIKGGDHNGAPTEQTYSAIEQFLDSLPQ